MIAGGRSEPVSIANPARGPENDLYTLRRRRASTTRGFRTLSIADDRVPAPIMMMTRVMSSWAMPRRLSYPS